ncbi:phosphoglycerate kinase [Methanolacinia petrolearia]|uniref:phosphoglycerate kinase n=1 Tax=Methanolacinia petrolearia TaxID=54120 RepID=UPI003BABD37F
MKIGRLEDLGSLRGTALLRVDFNSPIDPSSNMILDDKRFREHAPTVKALEDSKCVIVTHQSRPMKKDFTNLRAHAKRLERLIGRPVDYIDDIFGACARDAVKTMDYGEVLMLENVRFNSEEVLTMDGEDAMKTHLVKGLSAMADYYVFDAFGTAHRSQPTIVGLPRVMRSVAGLLMDKEVSTLSKVLTDAPGPVTFVLGGTKVDDSLAVAKNALEAGITDNVVFTGVVANVVYLAEGKKIGKPSTDLVHSLGYDKEIKVAAELLKKYSDRIVTPDHVAVKEDGVRADYPLENMPQDKGIMDLGIESLAELTGIISNSGTIVLNGPAGVFEDEQFSAGTYELIRASEKAEFSVVGGGHTAAVIEKMGVADRFSHISTGGGACIEFLTGKKLPAVEALEYSKEKFW